MAPAIEPAEISFPIFCIANRYLLFDAPTIAHVRRQHNICGVLIGTIPNLSQQNVFLGIPLELMPEEARVLVEQGHAYVVDDVKEHSKGFLDMNRERRLEFLQLMDQKGEQAAREQKERLEERSRRSLRKKGLVAKSVNDDISTSSAALEEESTDTESVPLFDSTPKALKAVEVPKTNVEPHFITPATSYPPLLPQSMSASPASLPDVPRQYPLFRYMHSKGYFSTPGLRFGCHYTMYPGDPLRFHSHFLGIGLGWDEGFELLDIVGGGRLGTGVKKAYLIGGEATDRKEEGKDAETSTDKKEIRTFSIEWAGI